MLFRAKFLFVAAKNAVPLLLAGAGSVIHGRFPRSHLPNEPTAAIETMRHMLIDRGERSQDVYVNPAFSAISCSHFEVERRATWSWPRGLLSYHRKGSRDAQSTDKVFAGLRLFA